MQAVPSVLQDYNRGGAAVERCGHTSLARQTREPSPEGKRIQPKRPTSSFLLPRAHVLAGLLAVVRVGGFGDLGCRRDAPRLWREG
jgi:hypothetical protein